MANGVNFGAYHSSNDLSLFLLSKSIGAPELKQRYISIPAGDGSVDLTECFGEPKYEDRELSFVFAKIGGDFVSVFSDVQNKLHGKKMQISLDADPGYYYYGRVLVKDWKANAATGEIEVDCLCEPYKYKNAMTTQEETISTSETVVLQNLRMTTYPIITTTAPMSIVKDGVAYSYETVTDYRTTIPLFEGDNELTVSGSGTITFSWQEGAI